jgi:serine/threonine-protein kinase
MEAHARGIVHRDIKPDNVMVVPLAFDDDYVKVMDFGIAKMVDSGEEITQHGITLGTPRYMPIEQLKGEHLGPATDLYATGLVLYEMLVGRPAFTGETAVDTAVAVMEGGSVTVPADAGVPEPLAAIIAKACARHAEDRYQSARDFLDALNELDPALLDVDRSELERFAPPEVLEALPRKAVTVPLSIETRKPFTSDAAEEDVEDATATQLLSTGAVLSTQAMEVEVAVQRPGAARPPLLLVVLDAATLLVALVILLRVI